MSLAPKEEGTTAQTALEKAEILTKGAVEFAEEKAQEMGIPTWGLVTIVILVLAIVCGLVFFCVRRFLKKRRTKDGKGKKGVDMKSVQLLGSAYKEKVQPDMEELTENAEEDEESKHSEQKLGKLQYKAQARI
uniref:Synaptotagmin n=1 Tax=Megaselia scalaris TaxID=36166 RepID=T1GKM3_MEGSC